MGKLMDRIKELQPKIDLILEHIPKVDTGILAGNLEDSIFTIFKDIEPFSWKLDLVCKINKDDAPSGYYSYGSQDVFLFVSEHLRILHNSTSFKNRRGGRSLTRGSEILKIVQKYGDSITDHVREPLKDYFPDLVRLSREIVAYDTLVIPRSVNIKITTSSFRFRGYHSPEPRVLELTEEPIRTILLKTRDPSSLFYSKLDKIKLSQQDKSQVEDVLRKFNLENEWHYLSLEDIIDEILALFGEATGKLNIIKEKNAKILTEMKDIIAPLVIAKELKR